MMLPLRSRARLFCTLPLVLALLAAQTGCGGAPSAPPSAGAAALIGPPGAMPASEAPPGAVGDSTQVAPPPAPGPAPGVPAPAPARVAQGAEPNAPAVKPADTRAAKKGGPTTRAPVIIYQGDLRMTADEDAIPKTIDRIIDVAEGLGGHLAARKDQSVQIKVPSASFREAMTKIEAIGGVVNRSVTADDVSEEFHDLEVRLVNLRATRARLQEFLTKAPSVQDMLTVEHELERVAQEVDGIEGRLEFLRTRAAMSVIGVALTPKPKSAPIVVTPPSPPAALRTVDIPVSWVGQIGIDPLLSLHK